jgi:hypothetical protein
VAHQANAAEDRAYSAACEAATATKCSFDSATDTGGACLKWLFKGRCLSSDPEKDCQLNFTSALSGGWDASSRHQCEVVNHCSYTNGTDVFGTCCPDKVGSPAPWVTDTESDNLSICCRVSADLREVGGTGRSSGGSTLCCCCTRWA